MDADYDEKVYELIMEKVHVDVADIIYYLMCNLLLVCGRIFHFIN